MTLFRKSESIVLTGVLVIGVAVALLLLPGFGEDGTAATMGAGYQLPERRQLTKVDATLPPCRSEPGNAPGP